MYDFETATATSFSDSGKIRVRFRPQGGKSFEAIAAFLIDISHTIQAPEDKRLKSSIPAFSYATIGEAFLATEFCVEIQRETDEVGGGSSKADDRSLRLSRRGETAGGRLDIGSG